MDITLISVIGGDELSLLYHVLVSLLKTESMGQLLMVFLNSKKCNWTILKENRIDEIIIKRS